MPSPPPSPGFILTKWYVNKRVELNLFRNVKRFILTKWYVNKKSKVCDRYGYLNLRDSEGNLRQKIRIIRK